MPAWKNRPAAPTGRTASTAGVLRPDEFARHVDLTRSEPSREVARWVENRWRLDWELPPGRHFDSHVVAHPTCSLTLEVGDHRRPETAGLGPLLVTGIVTGRFDVDVRGCGGVLGLRFRPGGLAALVGADASAWTDRTVSARDVLPAPLCEALSDPGLAEDPARWWARAETSLVELAPDGDARYDRILEVIADMLADRSLVTVGAVARRHGIAVRTLQRAFVRYVGVGPKWVLARYRMHDALAALDAGGAGTLTDVAHRYGWYDQAHFVRDFTALIGESPGRYLVPTGA